MPLIIVPYFGEVGIDAWEWLLGVVYLLVLFLILGRTKNMRIAHEPEYKHFLWGLYAKVAGGAAFSLIYFFYYGGGDTTAYFYSALAMAHLAPADPVGFLQVLFGANNPQHLSLFSIIDVKPLNYIYYDDKTFMVVRFITPFVMLGLGSYLLTTLLVASACYSGLWRCYQTMVGYFPSLRDKLAIAFLYVPSVIFWGSGILKDTITVSAACWWVHCFDQVFFKRNRLVRNITGMVVSAALLLMLKPYIFMALFPMTVLWLLYFRVARIRSSFIRLAVLPMALVSMLGLSYMVLVRLGDSLGKFSLDKALETTTIIQHDMKRSEQYGANFFDIGKFDGTLTGALKLAPKAINAALFRPYLWEADSMVVAISALENLALLLFTVFTVLRAGPLFFLRCMMRNPLVMLCIVFSILFAFMVGFTTPNFGALVRFKIPMLPFFITGLFIVGLLNTEAWNAKKRGRRFEFSAFLKGEPRMEGKGSGAPQRLSRRTGRIPATPRVSA